MKYAYYNEFDPEAADWLRRAIKASLIPDGEVDTRTIHDVKPEDVKPFIQRHYFSGIGGWSVALRLAGWPDDVPVTTASCPCQSFSCAGNQNGKKDPRHLWPVFFNLFRQSPTAILFGEQSADAIRKRWFDGEPDSVADCLQGEGYAVGMAVLSACAAGAPHKRSRLYFGAVNSSRIMGDSEHFGFDGAASHRGDQETIHGRPQGADSPRELARASNGNALSGGALADGAEQRGDERGCGEHSGARGLQQPFGGSDRLRRFMGDSQGGRRGVFQSEDVGTAGGEINAPSDPSAGRVGAAWRGPYGIGSHWEGVEWLICPDGKARAVKPGICLLADGLPSKIRKTLLRGLGNAVVPPLAAGFIQDFLGASDDLIKRLEKTSCLS